MHNSREKPALGNCSAGEIGDVVEGPLPWMAAIRLTAARESSFTSCSQRLSAGRAFPRLQGAVPLACRRVHQPHLQPAAASVLHKLRGGVEAHGLAVQERADEGRQVVWRLSQAEA